MAIRRIWHGWTTQDNAEKYRALLEAEVFPGIAAKNIAGYRSVDLLSRDLGQEVEFVTIMTFDSLQNVIDFQGEDYARSYVPDAAKAVLKRWDETAAHYQTDQAWEYRQFARQHMLSGGAPSDREDPDVTLTMPGGGKCNRSISYATT